MKSCYNYSLLLWLLLLWLLLILLLVAFIITIIIIIATGSTIAKQGHYAFFYSLIWVDSPSSP